MTERSDLYGAVMMKTILALMLVLAQGALPVGAQVAQEKIAAVPKINKPLPFKPGESLFYEVGFSKLISKRLAEVVLPAIPPSAHQAPRASPRTMWAPMPADQ